MTTELPVQGMIFWPVGCGDSTTISVKSGVVLQVDLHHMTKSEDEDDPTMSVIDELVRILPKKGNKPYLAVFALTHPDLDHCKGFKDLLDKVHIGELWFSPRVFDEYKKELTEDALAFRNEADRRVKQTIKLQDKTLSADRIRVIGSAEILDSDSYKELPKNRKSWPGQDITELDGNDEKDCFCAFVHAPFKDDCSDGERNDTSLAFQIHLKSSTLSGKALLLGDLAYPTIKKIYEVTENKEKLEWNVLQAPHHCSKKAMFWKAEGEDEEKLQQVILDDFSSTQMSPNWVVSSSTDFPETDEEGSNPPHIKARREYEEITQEFICTHEHVDEDTPHPILFELTEKGLCYQRPTSMGAKDDKMSAALIKVRGSNEPPKERVGFG